MCNDSALGPFISMMLRLARIRLVSINDVYTLMNYPRLSTMLSQLSPQPQAVTLCGDFISPSPLSSIDEGKGNIDTIRASGVTHACLGNHEADLKLDILEQRFKKLTKNIQLVNSNVRIPTINSPKNLQWWNDIMPEYSVIQSDCRNVSIALIGLLTDEVGAFHNGTFRGLDIRNVIETYNDLYKALVDTHQVDMILPITHLSIERDRELANIMIHLAPNAKNIILGGHDHDVVNECVGKGDAVISIFKSGLNANFARVIDLEFNVSVTPAKLVSVEQTLVALDNYEPAPAVHSIVKSHLSCLQNLQEQVIIDASRLIPPGKILSSKHSRQQQTTMGAVFCQTIKDELDVDVCLLNGAAMKGASCYPNAKLTYTQLQEEIPFPTKMVTVAMTRRQLYHSIRYSRLYNEDGKKTDGDKRGFLQTDLNYELNPHQDGEDDQVLQVSLPRNLLAGFCNIVPLIDLKLELEAAGKLPHNDDFTPAIDLVIRHACRQKWFDLLYDETTFDDIDLNHDGFLDRTEIKYFLERYLKKEVPDFVVNDMVNSIDLDDNGLIDIGEFSYLLAKMERELNWRVFY